MIGARVKSPVELLVGLLCDLDATPTPLAMDRLRVLTKRLKQSLLNPPNVAGWPGHHTWLSTTAIVERWTVTGQMINRFTNDNTLDLTALAETLYDPDGLPAVFAMPVALAEHLLSVPLDLLDLPTANLDFAGDLINNPLPRAVADGPAYVRNLTKLLLDGIPWYEWDLDRPNVPRYLRNYVRALISLPAFQLT